MNCRDENWDLIIRPKRHWLDLRLGELYRYRDLIQLFVWRDFVAVYKQTILGPLWYLIQPLFTTLVFTIIFGNIAHLPTDGLPTFLFYLAGQTVWSYFAACFTATSNTFINNSSIFGKVYFPRLTVPISIVISNLFSFFIRLGLFLAFWCYFLLSGASFRPTLWLLLIPFLIIIMASMGLGLGIITSSLTTKYRDLQNLVSFGITLLMYGTPVIYPLSTVTGFWHQLILLNPMTPVVEAFRLAFLGTGSLSLPSLFYSFVFAVSVLFLGILIFNQVEATFMDTV